MHHQLFTSVAVRLAADPRGENTSAEVHRSGVVAKRAASKTVEMSGLDEDQNLERVVDRLATRFPSLSAEHVRQVVDVERHRLENGTVRDFVPVLVEHAAMEQLRKEADPVRLRTAPEAPGRRPLDDPQELDPMERERLQRDQHGGFLFSDLDGGVS
jgi:hypothetical protein